jgi:hypothetical protein
MKGIDKLAEPTKCQLIVQQKQEFPQGHHCATPRERLLGKGSGRDMSCRGKYRPSYAGFWHP